MLMTTHAKQTPIRVMIVDDYDLIRASLRIIFESTPDIEIAGMARDGLEAIDVVEDTHPDVIIMDYNMPTMNGLDAARAIHYQHPETQIIVLSNHDFDADMRDQMKKAGVQCILPKHVMADTIINSVYDVTQKH